MTELYDAAKEGNLERVKLLVEQGMDKNQVGGLFRQTCLSIASQNNHLPLVQYLVEQGANMEKVDKHGWTPLMSSTCDDCFDVVRYLLEQGANRDKADINGWTPLHYAAYRGHLKTAKLLMVYGADLNVRNNEGELPIEMGLRNTEEIKQAIRDEPRRRMDEAPGKRATEQDRHPNTATLTSIQQEEDEEEHVNKKPRLDEGAEAVEGNAADEVAEEDQDSEPSDDEDDN